MHSTICICLGFVAAFNFQKKKNNFDLILGEKRFPFYWKKLGRFDEPSLETSHNSWQIRSHTRNCVKFTESVWNYTVSCEGSSDLCYFLFCVSIDCHSSPECQSWFNQWWPKRKRLCCFNIAMINEDHITATECINIDWKCWN